MLLIGVDEICKAREQILLTFTARHIQVDPHGELWFVLDQMEHYCRGTRDLRPGDTHSDTDDQAVEVGRELLRGLRLHSALVPLVKARVPHLIQTLRTLASFRHDSVQHRFQFDQSEYELYMAAQFQGHGPRLSFVDTRRPSRYRRRVEFMLGYKYPVECKHPQSERRIFPNIDAAIQKLEERQVPGAICIGLEDALHPQPPQRYLEVLNPLDCAEMITQRFAPWFAQNQERITQRLDQNCCRLVLFTYSVLAYIHAAEAVSLVTGHLAFAVPGEWIQSHVVAQCVSRLTRKHLRRP